jgi:transcriptional regulator with XRE-family HTH domain
VTGDGSVCRDPQAARRELGQRLAAERKAAGLTQRQLAEATRYSRSTVSNAEIGHPDVARLFWARCDRVLKPARPFAADFDDFRPVRYPADLAPDGGLRAWRQARRLISSAKVPGALAGYRYLGWPAAESRTGRAVIVTGDAVDALEVPAQAGRLAVDLWQYSQGRPDQVRQLPALPRPSRALAVIAAGARWYFLAAAGTYLWPGQHAAAPAGNDAGRAVIRWHSDGSQVPAPPSPLAAGQQATWAHLPSRPPQLAPAIGLLGLLATAAATFSDDSPGVAWPGRVRVLPASQAGRDPPYAAGSAGMT